MSGSLKIKPIASEVAAAPSNGFDPRMVSAAFSTAPGSFAPDAYSVSGEQKFDLRMWEFIFSTLESTDLKQFNLESLRDESKLKKNGKIFFFLYKKLYGMVTKNSKTLINLKNFSFSFTQLPPKNFDNILVSRIMSLHHTFLTFFMFYAMQRRNFATIA
jgi:hypothetical protein